MDMPVINRISDFDHRLNLNDPTFFSQIISISGFQTLQQHFDFFKWSALIIALLASFTTIVNRTKLLILRLRHVDQCFHSQPLIDEYDDESDFSCSSSDGEDEDEDEDEEDERERELSWRRVDNDCRVKGSSYYLDNDDENQKRCGNFVLQRRQRSGSFCDLFCWEDLAAGGRSVVKLWDNIGLGLRLDLGQSLGDGVLSDYDGGRGRNGFFPAVSASPAVVLAARGGASSNVVLGAWDTRVRCQIPAILAVWKPKRFIGKIDSVDSGGVEKIYLRNDASREVTIGDLRMVNSPLADLTESNVDTWWDADAVMVNEASDNEFCVEGIVKK